MTLGELLKLLREAILNDRTDRVDGSSDYLWTDETLVTYINEAQRRFAVQGLVLRDGSTDEVVNVRLVAGQNVYALHESILGVISAKAVDRDCDLTRVGHAVLAAYRAPTDRWIDPGTFTGLQPGYPVAYATDEFLSDQDNDSLMQATMRVFPTPTAEYDGKLVKLRVVRKPIDRFSVNGLSATPELPEDHHIEMLDYAAYLALRIVDDDAGAPKRAAEFKATFEESVREARALAMRKLFAPMGWGFGRGGFSWET